MNKEEIEKAKKNINEDIKKLNKNLHDNSYTEKSLEEIRESEKMLMQYIEQLENKVKEQEDKYILEKLAKEEVEELLENSISKDTIKEIIEKIKKAEISASESINECIVVADSDSLNFGRKEAHNYDLTLLENLLNNN